MFGLLYRFGYTPWDGHKLPRPLTEFIEGQNGAPGATPAEVLDIGCGTATCRFISPGTSGPSRPLILSKSH